MRWSPRMHFAGEVDLAEIVQPINMQTTKITVLGGEGGMIKIPMSGAAI